MSWVLVQLFPLGFHRAILFSPFFFSQSLTELFKRVEHLRRSLVSGVYSSSVPTLVKIGVALPAKDCKPAIVSKIVYRVSQMSCASLSWLAPWIKARSRAVVKFEDKCDGL